MPRPSKRDEIERDMQDYLAVAEIHSPEEYAIDVKSVAKNLHISRTTIYKYDFDVQITAARKRQQENANLSTEALEQQAYKNQLQRLKNDVKVADERYKALLARVMLIEGNAARLRIDPEQLYKPLIKPIRSASHAGRGAARKRKQRR